MDVIGQLKGKWEAAGYTGVKINLWHETYLFINLDGQPSFCYHLDKSGRNRGPSCKIQAQELLPKELFRDARIISYFVSKHKAEIAQQAAVQGKG